MIKSLRPQYMFLLLFAITVGMYCSSLIEISLKPAVISIDDRGLLQYLLNHKLTLRDIFFAKNPGKYYRPLLGLTYLIDQRLWGETIFGYRLTNVLIHTCNTLLMFLIGMTLFKAHPHRNKIPFLAALLFTVHPMAVESVAWISGRTDLLATFWSLLAFYLYLSVNDKNALWIMPLSLLCALAAALSKETGIIIFILIIGWEVYYRKYFDFPKVKYASITVLLLLSSGLLYFVLRTHALASRDMSMEMIWSRILSGDVLNSVKMFLSSYGFYIKKFIVPFPLQFAIDSINVNAYAFLGLAIILLFSAGMFISIVAPLQFFSFWTLLGLLPGAVVSCTDIAWTPWAERYLYFSLVPLSFISVMLSVQLINNLHGFPRKFLYACSAIVIILFASSAVQRAHMWNDDLALSYDTFKKSSLFIPAAVAYACSLKEKGRQDEAEQQLQKAALLTGPKHLLFYNLGIMSMSKDYEKARGYFLQALAEVRKDKKLIMMGPYLKKNILTSISDVEMAESRSYSDKKTKNQYYQRAIEYLVEAHNEDPSDSFLLYNIAKLYLVIGNNAEAKKCFEEFIAKWDNNDIYRQAAEKLLKKITNQAA